MVPRDDNHVHTATQLQSRTQLVRITTKNDAQCKRKSVVILHWKTPDGLSQNKILILVAMTPTSTLKKGMHTSGKYYGTHYIYLYK